MASGAPDRRGSARTSSAAVAAGISKDWLSVVGIDVGFGKVLCPSCPSCHWFHYTGQCPVWASMWPGEYLPKSIKAFGNCAERGT